MSADIHALSGAYAVNALADAERIEFEAHLATCAACRDEVDSLRAAASMLGESVPTPPPAAVRDAVLAAIAQIRPLPPVVPTKPSSRETAGGRRWYAALVAAAAVIALGAGAVVWHPWRNEATTQLTAIDRVMHAPDAKHLTAPLGSGKITLVRSKSMRQAVLTSDDMPMPPAGQVYELWLQNAAGRMVPAGLLPRSASQRFLLIGDAMEAKAAGITMEPEGGSDQPTTTPLALFSFEETT
jgi:anti-sigma-K factor RskA